MGTENLRKILESNSSDIKHARKKAAADVQKIEDEIKKIEKLISSLTGYVNTVRHLSYEEDEAIAYKMMGNTLEDCTRMKTALDQVKNRAVTIRKDVTRTKW